MKDMRLVVAEDYERRYKELMRSGAFLYALVDTEGAFLRLNQGMRNFLGYGAVPETLVARCPLEQRKELHSLLREAAQAPVAALVPLTRQEGGQVWMDVEFSPAELRQRRVVQIVGADVTEWTQAGGGGELSAWGCVLDSCPGLLCCVLDGDRKLLYATAGYRSLTLRLMGHSCDVGRVYPPLTRDSDRPLRHLLTVALQGRTDTFEFSEQVDGKVRRWNFTATPIRVNGETAGAVLRVLPAQPGQEIETKGASPFDQKALLDALAVPVALVDAGKGVCLEANEPLVRLLSGGKRMANRPLAELIPADNPMNAEFHRRLPGALAGAPGTLECRLSGEKGDVVWLEASVRPLEGARALVTFEDVTRLRRAQHQLSRMERVDIATGVLSREGLEKLTRQELERALREAAPLGLILLNIDGFRRLNEAGYAAADRSLKALAAALEEGASQAGGSIGRWSGDEFMVLIRRETPEVLALAGSLKARARELGLSLNVGVAEAEDGMDVSSFVGAAYDAMVRAKQEREQKKKGMGPDGADSNYR